MGPYRLYYPLYGRLWPIQQTYSFNTDSHGPCMQLGRPAWWLARIARINCLSLLVTAMAQTKAMHDTAESTPSTLSVRPARS